MSKEYCSTPNPNIVQDNFSLALFDFNFREEIGKGKKMQNHYRSMIAVIQNPQLPLSSSYNFTHVQIDKIINPPEWEKDIRERK